ncbi:Translation initiation factor IF-3 [Gossypium arboreum]|uniref:Translation initiation factor IF-3 n=1 Tax=Gossypium arboreum TaxID=29729 RepID=A0A0B0P759_GOSAR|nr:Translation initiation factor IF-3 [Gossypium arboreum]
MAGITTSFPFKTIPTRPTKTIPLLLSSLQSKLFGIHVRNPNSFSSPLHCSATINARYGADSRFSPPGRSKKNDEDQALDLSAIRSDSVRLIDEEQSMIGIVSKSQAIQMAEDAGLDLVILSPDADPPVVRIMDYNKYRYEQQKKKKVQQKKTNRMDLKELKMGYNIDQHDYSVRLKAARKFLNDGDKVKVIVNLKGRENEFRNMAMELIRRFQNDVGELATEESKNFKDRNIFIVLVPNKAVLQKAQQDPGKKKDKPTKNEVSAGV